MNPSTLIAASAAALLALAPLVFAQDPAAEDAALANGLYGRGLFEMAAAEYSALLAADPARPDRCTLSFRLGECQRRTGHPAEAAAAYRAAAEADPKSADGLRARLQLGLADLEAGRAAEAAPVLQQLAADSTDDAGLRSTALFYAAEAHSASGNPALAVTLYGIVREVSADQDTIDYATLRLAVLKAGAGDDASVAEARGLLRALADRPAPQEISAEALFRLAVIAETLEQPDEAAARYLELIGKYPGEKRAAESRLRAAWTCFESGRFAEARRLATDILDAPGGREGAIADDALYLRANAERQLEMRAEAIADYSSLIAAHPDSEFIPSARYERILTLHRDGRHADAIAEGDKFEDPPADLLDDLLWLLAESASAIPDPPGAVQRYRMLLRRTPDSPYAPQALYRLANLLQEQKAWAEASASYHEFCDKFPGDPLVPAALYASGACLANEGRADEAIRDWQELAKRFPDDERVPESLYQRAIEHIRAKRNQEAAAALDEFLRRFPAHARAGDATFWRGVLFHEAGDDSEASRLLRALLDSKPSRDLERESMFILGTIAHAQGRSDEAAALLQPLLDSAAREKFTPESLAWLASFQFERGDFDSSALAAKSLFDSSDDPVWKQTALVLTARTLRAKNDPQGAIDAYSKALDTGVNGPQAPEAALRLGELLLDAGRLDEAVQRLGDAVRRAAAPELAGVRARATFALSTAAEARGDKADAIRYAFAVAILYDDPEIVPAALDRAATLLDGLGRKEESLAAAQELVDRYPDSEQGKAWRKRIDAGHAPAEPAAAEPASAAGAESATAEEASP